MYNIPLKYKKQFQFINESDIFPITKFIKTESLFEEMFYKLQLFVENSDNKKISIVSFYEPFISQLHIDKIIEFMNSTGKEFYLSAPTSSSINNFFEPLINIYFWKSREIGSDVSWVSYLNNSGIFLFKKNRYEILQPKNNKGILSIRKITKKRDYLNSIFDVNSFDWIYRYIQYPQQYGNDLEKNIIKKYPSMNQLINEYK